MIPPLQTHPNKKGAASNDYVDTTPFYMETTKFYQQALKLMSKPLTEWVKAPTEM